MPNMDNFKKPLKFQKSQINSPDLRFFFEIVDADERIVLSVDSQELIFPAEEHSWQKGEERLKWLVEQANSVAE